MATVRDILQSRLERARGKKQRLQAELAAVQTDIDEVKAELDTLTPAEEARLDRLQRLAVLKAGD